MGKKNIISTKTFEEFKTGNAEFYQTVLDICNKILKYLTDNGITKYKDPMGGELILAGDWDIEGHIAVSDLTSADEKLSKDIFFHNAKNIDDYITLDISGTGSGEPFTENESEPNLDVNSITYFHDGADITISVTTEIEKIILEIIKTIAE